MSYGICPFCLHKDARTAFVQTDDYGLVNADSTNKEQRRKDKVNSHMLLCRTCGRRMRPDSLLTENSTVQAYATFVFEYPHFWKSIEFEKWAARLKTYGMATEFWDAYHKLKAGRA